MKIHWCQNRLYSRKLKYFVHNDNRVTRRPSRITSQIYDSDNSCPTGADTLKAPQSHHLKNASCVINIPQLEIFMARHCYQQ